MNKSTLFLLSVLLSVASISLFAQLSSCATSVSQVQVDAVDRFVEPVYGGALLVNDTVRISPTVENATVEDFSIGFPSRYGQSLRFSMAFDADSGKPLELISDTGLDTIGYYGVTVVLPMEARNQIYSGNPYTFTVAFVFSSLVDSVETGGSTGHRFTIDFPVYPSLTIEALKCNVTVILPEDTEFAPGDFPFNATEKSGRVFLNHTVNNLPSLSSTSVKVSFTSETSDNFVCFSVNSLSRTTTVDAEGHVTVSELFTLKSETVHAVDSIRLQVPSDAANLSSFDEQGKKVSSSLFESQTPTYEISLSLVENQSRAIQLAYSLSDENRLVQLKEQSYMLNSSLFENLRVLPNTFSSKFVFPEGAEIQLFPQETFSVQRGVFQDVLSLSLSNVTWLQNEQWSFTYSYVIFWASFRPTLWMTTMVFIAFTIAFAWRRPRAPAPVSDAQALVPRGILNDFVETYETKKKVSSELEQLKQKASRGKISRRRYKIRKTTLDSKRSTLSKKLADTRQQIMSGGAKYADTMRQLEVAEVELDNIEADIRRIEVRFKRGEVSARTYRRLLEDDLKRRQKARTTIDGVLLRLRE